MVNSPKSTLIIKILGITMTNKNITKLYYQYKKAVIKADTMLDVFECNLHYRARMSHH